MNTAKLILVSKNKRHSTVSKNLTQHLLVEPISSYTAPFVCDEIQPICQFMKGCQIGEKESDLNFLSDICNAPTTQIYRWFNFVTWSNGTGFQFLHSIIAIDRHQWEAIKSEQLWFGLFQCWSCIYFPLHWLFGGNSDNKEMSKHC